MVAANTKRGLSQRQTRQGVSAPSTSPLRTRCQSSTSFHGKRTVGCWQICITSPQFPKLPSRLNQPLNCSGTCDSLCDPDLPRRTECPPAKTTYLPSVIGHVMLRKMHLDLGSVLRFCGLGICGVQSAERGLWWCATMSGECMFG